MDAPRSFWSTVWSQPAGPHSRLSRYTMANGALYLAIGAALYLLPIRCWASARTPSGGGNAPLAVDAPTRHPPTRHRQ